MPSGRRAALWLIGPLLATALAYAPSLGNGFAMDDRLVALGVNDAGQPARRVFERRPLREYFSTPYWGDTQPNDRLYRPLTVLSFALRHRLAGDAALPEHAANLALHLLATAIVFALARGIGLPAPAAGAGAAVFGLHAIHSEVVASVVGRSELGAFVGGGIATLLALRAEERRGGAAAALTVRAGAALALLAALLFKENAVGWLVAAPALVLAARARGASERGLDRRAIAGVVARCAAIGLPALAIYLLLRQRMLAGLPGDADPVLHLVNPIAAAPTAARWATGTAVLAYGLALCAAPFRLAADYGAHVFPVLGSFAHPLAAAAAALLVSVAVAAWRSRRGAPELAAAAAVFFGFALVIANLLFPIGTIFGERLYYAPSLAIALAAAAGVARAAVVGRGAAAALALGVWLGASTLVVVERNGVWRDDATLFLHEADHQPRSARMQMCAATVLGERGEREAAARRLERALAIEPELALAWSNLAAIRFEQGRLEAAEDAARRGLAARHRGAGDEFKLRANLGLVLAARGESAAAGLELARALALEPGFVRAWSELERLVAAGRLENGALAEAIAVVEAAPARPGYAELYRGLAALREGRYEAADAALARALALAPRRGPWAAAWSAGAVARAEALLRLGRAAEGRALLDEIAADRFAPREERELAASALAALAGG